MKHETLRSWVKLAAMAAIAAAPSTAVAGTILDSNFTEQVFISDSTNLGRAVQMEWAPDGSNRLFVVRKTGQVRIIKSGVLLTTPFASISPIYTISECGLLDLAFDPNFGSNGYVYFFVTVSSGEQQIIRYTDTSDVGMSKTVIVANLPTAGVNHDGGALAIGPDNRIYWAIGDNGSSSGSDSLSTLRSKVGRANLNGSIPTSNPFYDDGDPAIGNNDYIWAQGFRNPFTMTFHPSGQLWLNVVGASYEQIFTPVMGDHGGWPLEKQSGPTYIAPVIAYQTNGTFTRSFMASPNGAVRSGGVVTFTTTTNHGIYQGELLTISGVNPSSFNGSFYVNSVLGPAQFTVVQAGVNETGGSGSFVTLNQGGAVTGGTFYTGTLYPGQYQGNFFYGDYNSGRIMRATLDGSGNVTSVDYFISGVPNVVDVNMGPDEKLYYVRGGDSTNGTIYRLDFVGGDGTPPSLGLDSIVISGTVLDPTVSTIVLDGITTLTLVAGNTFSPDVPLTSTPQPITLTATDGMGNFQTRTITVTQP